MIRFAIIIPILMKSNHNLIKNWDEKWKINKLLDFFPDQLKISPKKKLRKKDRKMANFIELG